MILKIVWLNQRMLSRLQQQMLFVDHAQILLRAGKKGNLYLFFYDYNYFL